MFGSGRSLPSGVYIAEFGRNSSPNVHSVNRAKSRHRIQSARVSEGVALALLSSGFLALTVRTAPQELIGPDTWKYLQIAGKQVQGNFWFDPSAFDHNYWPIGYPTFLAIQFEVFGEDTIRTLIVQASWPSH